MKKTRIKIRAYCCDFEIEVNRKEYMTLEDAGNYVRKEIIDTAFIIEITHINPDNPDKSQVIKNKEYKCPTKFSVNLKQITQ